MHVFSKFPLSILDLSLRFHYSRDRYQIRKQGVCNHYELQDRQIRK